MLGKDRTYLDGDEHRDNAEHHVLDQDAGDVSILIVVNVEK